MSIPIWPVSPETIERAGAALRAGDLVVFPTETVYGLGGDATNGRAVAKIYEVKGRPQFNPLIVHVLDLEHARSLARFDSRAEHVARVFWPGPLTLVLPSSQGSSVHDLARAGLSTVAVRVPSDPVARDLIKAAGVPIVAPSANRSGRLSPTAPHHVVAQLEEGVAGILAGGMCAVGLESTVLDLTSAQPTLLRPGAITQEDIEAALETSVAMFTGETQTPRAPGQLLAHYAPRIPVRLKAVDVGPGEALLAFGSLKFMGVKGGGAAKDLPSDRLRNLSETGDLAEAATHLFAYLNDLDHPNHTAIAVMDIPNTGLGVAINDRLKRAAGNY